MSKGSKSQTVTQRVDIPDFLQPLARQQARLSGEALTSLQSMLGGDLTAGFTPDQLQAFDLARSFATGADGFLPVAQSTLMGAAQGVPLASFVDPTALSALTGTAAGQGIGSFLPSLTLETLSRGAQGGAIPTQAFDALGNVIEGEVIPGAATEALARGATSSAIPSQAFDAIVNILGGELLPGAATETLSRTAQGDFLLGGPGFDAAVQAAVRAAQPGILSTFGRGGSGAATGGLAQAAIGQAATDAFARQFAQERANQLQAAQSLGQLGLAGASQRMSAAGLLGNLGLAGSAQQLQAAQALGQLGLAGAGQRASAAGLLGQLGLAGMGQQLQAAGALGDFASQERARQLASAGQLAGLSESERQRQLSAAGALPGLGMVGADVLSRIGGQQQAQAQQELMAPILAQQQLLGASGGGLPLAALLGSTQSQPMQS